MRVDECGKSKAEKYQHNLTLATVKKGALEDELTLLKHEQNRIDTAHKNEIRQIEADRSVKLEIQKLAAQRILEEEKLKVKEKDLEVSALKEKIARLEDVVSSQQSKVREFDQITAQAVKANIGIFSSKEKASVR